MLRRLYDRLMALAASRDAPAWLALVAFAESSFFPAPPDLMLAPMVLARRDRAWSYALLCTVASVLGGILGYTIGIALAPLGLAILKAFGHAEGLEVYRQWFAHNGFVVILLKGLTPIPFKLVTIASGLAHFDFGLFVLASVLTRGGRFFLVAGLLKAYGPPIQAFVEKRLTLVTTLIALALVLAVVVLKFIGH